jgi:hypothetical protein
MVPLKKILSIRHFWTRGELHRTRAVCCPANHPPRTGEGSNSASTSFAARAKPEHGSRWSLNST